MTGRARQTLIALLLTCLWGFGLGIAHTRGNTWFLDRVEAGLTDFRTLLRGPRHAPDLVTIIAIDDETARIAGGYPIDRVALARIVDAIAEFKPKVIALDLLLVDPGPEEGDAALARALGRSASVIAAAAVYPSGIRWTTVENAGPLAGIANAEKFLLPLKRFTDASALGVANVVTDSTGTPRFVPMLFTTGGRTEASFALRAAALAGNVDPVIEPGRLFLGGRAVRTDFGHALPLNFYGPRGAIRTVSGASALNGQLTRDSVYQRIVVIGVTATGGGDAFSTPFDPVLPGVEVISTAISHLTTGGGLVRDNTTRLADAGTALLLSLLLVGLLAWRRSTIGFAAIAGAIIAWMGINFAAFSSGIWLSAALPLAVAAPSAMLFGLAQIWFSRRSAKYFADQSMLLQRFQAPVLGQWLTRHPDFLAKPVRQNAAIVFIDLSGFTGLSQTLGPAATRELLNDFYALAEREVAACGGVITSFAGDGAMIVFGLPEPAADDPSNAAQCCIRLADCTRNWLSALPASISSRIGFKIGAHFGEIVASRLGSGHHQQITATGDTTNLASRLMEVAAGHGAEIAMSDEMLRIVGRHSAPFELGVLSGPLQTSIRGRSGSLAVWLWQGKQPS